MALGLATLVFCAAASAQSEGEEADKILKIGGKVWRGDNGKVARISLPVYAEKYLEPIDLTAFLELEAISICGGGLTSKTIASVKKLPPGLSFLSLHFAPIGDEEVIPILQKQNATLTGVNLPDTRVTDKTLAELGKCKGLIGINLRGTKITDKGLKELRNLEGIGDLGLGETAITDKGLQEVIHHRQLKSLSLDYTEVTDDGIRLLAGLEELRFLSVKRTNVSMKGKKALREALPNLKFLD
jgi:hypothetical protein